MRNIIFFLAAFAGLAMAIDVSECRVLSSAGTYDLVADLQGANISTPVYTAGAMSCLRVTGNNVTIDCHGHSITENSTGTYRYGISTSANYTTLRNCIISGYNGTGGAGVSIIQNSSLTVSRRIQSPRVENVTGFNNYYGLFAYNYDSGSGFYGTRGMVIADSSFYENRYGIYLSSYATNFTIINTNASDNNYSGIITTNLGASNSSFIGNTASNNRGNTSASGGLYLDSINYNITIANNTAEGNGYYGIYYRSLNTTVANNTMNGNAAHGMYADPFFSGPSYYTVQNNTARGNGMYGMVQYGYSNAGSSLSFYNNTAAGNGNGGFALYGPIVGSVDSNLAENNTGSGFHFTSYFGGDGGTALNVTVDDNRAFNNTYGISVYSGASPPSNLSFLDNEALENTKFDFYVNLYDISSTGYCDVISLGNMTSTGGRPILFYNATSSISGVEAAEIVLCDADASVVTNVSIRGSDAIPNNGISLHKTDNSTFENLSMSDDFASFDLVQSHWNQFRNISVLGSAYGVNNYHYFVSCCPTFRSSENNTFTDMNLTGTGTAYYFDFNSLGQNNVTGGVIRDSTGPGMVVNTSLVFLNGTRFCNNNPDMRVWADTGFAAYIGLNATDLAFEGPSCNGTGAVNLTITDRVGSVANYSINWSATPATPPSGRFPFKGMLNFTRFSSSSVDRMVYGWRDDELSGVSESSLRLYKYDASWASVNSSPSTSANILSQFNVTAFSVYGIFGADSPPAVSLLSPPTDSGYFNTTSLNLSFSASDNSPTLSCTLYLDSSPNQTDPNVTQGSPSSFQASGLSDGWHMWQVRCTDAASSTGNSSVWFFMTDNAPPAVYLQSPENGSSIPQGEAGPMMLEYYADDTQSYMQSCSLYLDGQLNDTQYDVYSSEGYPYFEVWGIQPGWHNWSVLCNDSYYSGTSETWWFEIYVPSYLCNATLIAPSGASSILQNGTFNVTSSVSCCGGTTNCSAATATLDPADYTPQTCSGFWGSYCGERPESADNTVDSCSSEGVYPDEYVAEAYINATSVNPGEELTLTCEFDCIYDGDYAYAWHYDGSGWSQLASWDWDGTNFGCSGAENRSVSFTASETPGNRTLRCGISYAPDYDECADSSSNYHDNDDINFTVESGSVSINSIGISPQPLGTGSMAACSANVTGANQIAEVFFNITYPDMSVLALGNGTQSGDIWESAPFNASLGGTYVCTAAASDVLGNSTTASEYFGTGIKGAIPSGNGTPFFTVGPNPESGGCLDNMGPGSSCSTTWTVNATGSPGTTWEFFVIYNGTNETLETDRANVSITAPPAQEAPPSGDDDEEEPDRPLAVSASSSCAGNTVRVTSGGKAVEGAAVVLDGLRAGTTDGEGEFSFGGCGKAVGILARRSGYETASVRKTLVDCSQCGIEPPVRQECACGFVFDGKCVEYECCSDSACDGAEFCDIPAGQAGGACKPVVGQCGFGANHTWIPYGYQCGTEPGCPSCPDGFECKDHSCIGNDLKGPESGIVGGNITVNATENDGPCSLCDMEVTTPAGRVVRGRTEEDGSFRLPLDTEGVYRVSLIRDGEIIKTIEVRAFPKAEPEEPEKPSQAVSEDFPWWLLIVLLLIILGIIYWKRRKEKWAGNKEKKP